jgi:2-phospho-L-lactate/phosphoenolpyruvate guanylyltransferase
VRASSLADMTTDLLALVPLRSPGLGKTRLAPALDRDARAALAGAMLADVIRALRDAEVTTVVAASGPAAAAAASALQTDVVLDPPGTRSLDQAIEQARLRVAPRAGLLVVQADLPLLQADDIHAVIEQDAPVVVAPTSDGGTSALLRRPSGVIGTAFGRGSGRAHVRLAEDAEVLVAVVRRPGLAHDVDDLGDLTAIQGLVGPATRSVLDQLGLDRVQDASGC